MRRLKTVIRERGENGAALPFVAAILVLLLGIAAFAIDLGWLYLNSARLQRAADSSALAGVVYLPAFPNEVTSNAVDGANANGWSIGTVNGVSVGAGSDSLAWRQLTDNRLEVTLHSNIPTFFLKVLGFDDFDITRTATAEYVKPVPLGSPNNSFGDGSNKFWASINGRWTAAIQGDPFQTRCDWARGDGSSTSGGNPSGGSGPYVNTKNLSQSYCIDSSATNHSTYFSSQNDLPGDIDSDSNALNPEFDQFGGDGYYYGIEIRPGRSNFLVQLLDPAFRRPNGSGCGSTTMGDCDRTTFSPTPSSNSIVIGPDTRYRLYTPDATPLDPRDGLTSPGRLLCDTTYTSTTGNSETSWTNFCNLSSGISGGGIYVLRVSTSNGVGYNQYGVRATTTGSGSNLVRTYGINNISIYTNQDATTATVYLAEIDPIHRGKILEVSFYDAGEDDGNASFTLKMPGGAAGATATCSWTSEGGASGSSGPCNITTTMNNPSPPPSGIVGRFNSQWLTVQAQIPDNYACDITAALGCWWSMSITNSSPHDRTTWTARIIGNPVRLVPNE